MWQITEVVGTFEVLAPTLSMQLPDIYILNPPADG